MNTEISLKELEEKIALYKDFPIEGVLFRDLTPVFKNHFKDIVNFMSELFDNEDLKNTYAFAGVESRGFILASALASKLNKGVVLIRKSNKLPGDVISESYSLEYGSDCLEVQKNTDENHKNVIVVDDLLATGGTLTAALNLCAKAGYKVLDTAVCIDLKSLNSFSCNDKPAKSLYSYS